MTPSLPSKRHHRGTWFVVLVGLLEIAVIVAFFELKGVATAVCGVAAGRVAPAAAAGNAGLRGLDASLGGMPGTAVEPSTPAVAGSPVDVPASAPPVSASTAVAEPADASGAMVAGDTNQIVDPNCVAKTAAGLLSENTPPPGPTCGPMKQPEALKAAERQIEK